MITITSPKRLLKFLLVQHLLNTLGRDSSLKRLESISTTLRETGLLHPTDTVSGADVAGFFDAAFGSLSSYSQPALGQAIIALVNGSHAGHFEELSSGKSCWIRTTDQGVRELKAAVLVKIAS